MKKMLGVMLDTSRNLVLQTDTVKRYADIIGKMGYNTLMLYTEDTYEVDGEPYFGHLRGRYSKDEMRDMDKYCSSIGIELIPCIQTLAHLTNMFKWPTVYGDINDCDDILLIGEERTYQLIEAMISTLRSSVSTDKIHIGMDEAYRVGMGKYEKKHGRQDKFSIINAHLKRVCEICAKYGFKPMIWSDMFTKLALGNEDQFSDEGKERIKDIASLPEDVTLVYWDYYSKDYDRYNKLIKVNQLFERPVVFAGGAWTWVGFAPDNGFSMQTTAPAVRACLDNGVDGLIFTVWGDNGSECSKFSILPSLLFAAEYSRGNTDIESIKKRFLDIVGYSFDSFMLLDKVSVREGKHTSSSSKYLLYNDVLMGIRDGRITGEESDYYRSLCSELEKCKNGGEFDYLFDFYISLSSALEIKSTIGIRLRRAYLERDVAALRRVADDIGELGIRLDKFYKTYKSAYLHEAKPHASDVIDIRLGGLMKRLESAKERVESYLAGQISDIPELSEPVLDEISSGIFWEGISSAGQIAGQ